MELSKKKAACMLCAAMMAFGTFGCSKDEPEWSYTMAASARPRGLIRVVPIKPLDGTTYPASTAFTPGTKQITFAHGSANNVWFAIELSGWGPTDKLTGFGASLLVSDAYCPHPPCGCVVDPASITCITSGDCAAGSHCGTSGACTTAFVDDSNMDFVFNGKSYSASITPYHPEYWYDIKLKSGEPATKEPSYPLVGGHLVVNASDFCWGTKNTSSFRIDFDPMFPPYFILDSGVTYPIYEGALIFSETP